MENIITISGDVPKHLEHLITYWLGVLIGMGISYKIDSESPMYRTLLEKQRELYTIGQLARERKDKIPYNNMGYRIIHESGDSEAITVKIKDI